MGCSRKTVSAGGALRNSNNREWTPRDANITGRLRRHSSIRRGERGGALRHAQGLEQAKRVETAGGGHGDSRANPQFQQSVRLTADKERTILRLNYDARPVHHELRKTREPCGSRCSDWHCPGEPESEICFLIEEQRDCRLTTGFLLSPRCLLEVSQRGFF